MKKKIICAVLIASAQLANASGSVKQKSVSTTMLIYGEPNDLSTAIPDFKSVKECEGHVAEVTRLLSILWDRHATARCTEKQVKLGEKYNPLTQKVGSSMMAGG